MRIIGGNYKKKKLISVPGDSTRPTSDRLRETIFNIISFDIADSVVLDLFSGTGALGIEALSRNAEKAVFIDNQPKAISTIKKNIAGCSFEDKTRVFKWDIKNNLNCLSNQNFLFDLVFIDPPYSRDLIPVALRNLEKTNCLNENSKLIIEHSITDSLANIPDCYSETDTRKYGKTAVTFLSFTG